MRTHKVHLEQQEWDENCRCGGKLEKCGSLLIPGAYDDYKCLKCDDRYTKYGDWWIVLYTNAGIIGHLTAG